MNRAQRGNMGPMSSLRRPGSPGGQGTDAPGPALRRPTRRIVVIAAGAAAFVVIAATLAGAAGRTAGRTSRAIRVVAAPAATVRLQTVPGQLTIVAAATRKVVLTGQLHWARHAPAAAMTYDRAASLLRLSYRCAVASPCTGSYLLVVPPRTAVVLSQPSGHVVISGLAGPLRITGRNVDVSATRLRSPALAAAITSGHLSAIFDAAPRRVSITLISAQATLRLPASTGYAVSSQVTAGYVHIGVPQARNAARTVAIRISSGELELLPR
jgi:hypothetical protein